MMAKAMWKVNAQEYFEAPAASLLVFHDFYPDGRQSGLELIHHDERIAANGDLRLGSWRFSKLDRREATPRKRTVTAFSSYSEVGVGYAVRVEADGPSLRVILDIAQPLPEQEARGAHFHLDLFAPPLWGKTYHLGETVGIFPRQDNGTVDASGPVPLARGHLLSIAPEDPMRHLTIERLDGEMQLLNGDWYVVRAPIAPGATTRAVELLITPHQIRGWRRPPSIGVSQIGYHPEQAKRAVIEFDPRMTNLGNATLLRVEANGALTEAFTAPVTTWGSFLRYHYGLFDFTHVTTPGAYVVRYGAQQTLPFRIGSDVYARDVWQPTLETYLPVQMCHVAVLSRHEGLIWHGACHLDDALQAPAPLVHIDGYAQGPETETNYQANEHIPGVNTGGWHDAGDDDLAAGAQAETTFWLALARDIFQVDSDQTTVNQEEKLVILHRPDGVPDLVQQVAHGVYCLLGGYHAAGHSFSGIIHSTQAQRICGDWASVTDNRIYDASLGPKDITADRSGKQDDRWAFTSRDSALEYKVVQALTASSRVLRGYEDALAEECLQTAIRAWEYEQTHEPVQFHSAYVPRHRETQEIAATAELLITTGEERFRRRLLALQPAIVANITDSHHRVHTCAWTVARALPFVNEASFTSAVRDAVTAHRANVEAEISQNPYRIPWHPHIWGVGWDVQLYSCEQYFLVKAFPELFDLELVLAVVNYVLGCHPGSNISFACGVGANTLTCEYSYLRAHWGYIPGAVVSGTALIRPDFPELKENFPFLWQQSEDVIAGAATYVFAILAAEDLLH